ncbi:MAG: hypothetical protein LJE61_08075 [Thiocapsa sp.]|nr:hypothetical protein [Thiocapsa sp.]MCG6897514.1 hypothetical protein [Thiocapsa sp.]MCG6985138.1 hypothetical protein [Thiocapsa sp.]
MTHSARRRSARIRGCLLLIGMTPWCAAVATSLAPAVPVLWGAGVKPCSDFLMAAPADGAANAIAGEGYRRYREWLAGLVTGLNLATGRDVLAGADLDAALTRIRASCERYPSDDFFGASMRLVRSLSDVGSD